VQYFYEQVQGIIVMYAHKHTNVTVHERALQRGAQYIPYNNETCPGEQTIHLSTCFGSNCVTQTATRSP